MINDNEEIWVKINNNLIIDDYLISNKGHIKRISSNYIYKDFCNNKYAYISVSLKCKDGKRRRYRVNRLVAQTFIPNPNNYPVVDHIDENPQNNNVENLRWCTYQQNTNFYLENKKKRLMNEISKGD